ncbi:MAG: phosphomannomutase/phosphoglucomutase [Chloroflexi bacterium]|nr:phosphomannomutase/phosphoglucomutase [Chloroflexota bacterium]
MSIFKSCDIRGVYGVDLNERLAFDLGRAIARRHAGRAVVGGDLRESTPALKGALLDGLCAAGAEVVDLGMLPTPAFYHAKRLLQAPVGAMVTASHNPARYNGFKLMFGDLPVEPEDVEQLAHDIATLPPAPANAERRGCSQSVDTLADYQAALTAAFRGLSARRVVVDAGNGSMWQVAPAVLRACGQEVVELYCTPDGRYPNRDPNPSVPAHLQAARQAVRASGAALGVAYDGDGDRVIAIDERGRVLPSDRLLVLFARHLLAHEPGGAVVYDLKSSSVVADEVRRAGGRPLMERSGHAFIKRRLLLEQALLGGEVSGHYFFGALGGDDALYATLALLQALDTLGMSLAEAIDSVPTYPITPDLRLPCAPERARGILAELQSAFADHPIDLLDGVRVQFAAGWALARLSVTEPLLTLRFEARSEAELEAIQREVRARTPQLDALMREAGL